MIRSIITCLLIVISLLVITFTLAFPHYTHIVTIEKQYDFGPLNQYKQSIITEAKHNNIEPELIAAVIYHESRGMWNAHGRHGEIGLMQIMPYPERQPNKLWDPDFNIKWGSHYLAGLVRARGTRGGLSAYNAGPDGYYQTAYVESVLRYYAVYATNTKTVFQMTFL